MHIKPDAPCRSCPLWGGGTGYVPADGTGESGVLVVAEAAGESEAESGTPLCGKAGHYLFSNLARAGVERTGLRLHNVLSCRPPNNKLVGMSYERAAIEQCSILLDLTIEDMKDRCKRSNKTFTIVTLGKVAFKRIMNLDEKRDARLLKSDYFGYPFWSERYSAYVIAGAHPSYLMRGNHHELPVLQYVFQRALEIASNGLQRDKLEYLLDPDAAVFRGWVQDFKVAYDRNPSLVLSVDIETPMKQDMNEEEVAKEGDDDYTILRCSFAYAKRVVSVPWRDSYLPFIEELMAHPCAKLGWNFQNYDAPRIMAQMPIHGDILDGMLAWHVLNSSLPKGLGFVTPFYWQNAEVWKHLSKDQPAYYNAVDADAALRCWIGIKKDLITNNQWYVFDRHVTQVNGVFAHMRDTGVLLDQEMRATAEKDLTNILKGIENAMDEAVPQDVRKLKVFKKTPKDTSKLIQVKGERKTKQCPQCHALDVKASHFKSIGKKRLKTGEAENPCHGSTSSAIVVASQLWAEPQDFKISKVGLLAYQKALKHQAIFNRKENKVTFDEKAILRLQKKYPKDPLYPLILEHRSHQKLLSNYIGVTQLNGTIKGGMPVGPDGRVHPLFTHNPSTLRSACQNPNLQNLPRTATNGVDVRGMFKASEGSLLWAADYAGIEAVLVGYYAHSKDYIRLAKRDIHTFYTSYALHELEGRFHHSELPQLIWPDDQLFDCLAKLKSDPYVKQQRNHLYKHLVHGANFMQGAKGAAEKIFAETGVEYDVKLVQKVMDIYFELFPAIRKWHYTLLNQADRDGHLRNVFSYVHRFHRVFEWEKVGSRWEKSNGPDSNRVIAFLPQSTAAGIIKEAMLRIYQNHYEAAGQYLRLLIHDELMFEVPKEKVDFIDELVQTEMRKPVPELVLPTSWGMGDCLGILTESKRGLRWSEMQ